MNSYIVIFVSQVFFCHKSIEDVVTSVSLSEHSRACIERSYIYMIPRIRINYFSLLLDISSWKIVARYSLPNHAVPSEHPNQLYLEGFVISELKQCIRSKPSFFIFDCILLSPIFNELSFCSPIYNLLVQSSLEN